MAATLSSALSGIILLALASWAFAVDIAARHHDVAKVVIHPRASRRPRQRG